MTLKAEETKIVTIDGQARAVDILSDEVKQLIRFYDDWKQKELEARSELLKVQTAMRAMAAQIANAVQEADKAAEGGGEEAATEGAEVVAEEASGEASE